MANLKFHRGRKLPLLLALWVGPSACSLAPNNIPAGLVGSEPFDSMTCERLQAEKTRRTTSLNDLTHPALFPSISEGSEKKMLLNRRVR